MDWNESQRLIGVPLLDIKFTIHDKAHGFYICDGYNVMYLS